MLKLLLNILKLKLASREQINKRNALIDCDRKSNAMHKRSIKKLVLNGHSAIGYVPYVDGKTELLIFNFFAANYGVRSTSTVVISLTDENFKPIHTSIHELKYREAISHKPKIVEGKGSPIFCTVLIVNESIRRNHGSNNGHFRFWGTWSDFSAFTHSMPLPHVNNLILRGVKKIYLQNIQNKIYDRRFFPRELVQAEHFSPQDGVISVKERGDLSLKLMSEMGFSLFRSHGGEVCGCYHNSPYSRNEINSFNEVEHIVALPNIASIDALLYFGECCEIGAKFIVSIFNSDDEINPLSERVIEIKTLEGIRLSTLFSPEIFRSKKSLWVKFKAHTGHHRDHYVNVIYANKDNQSLYDGVHSHSFAARTGRSLKFSPFRNSDQSCQTTSKPTIRQSVLAIWGHESQEIKYRLRILSDTDRNFELVCQQSIQAKAVKFIDLMELVGIVYPKTEFFYVQLESEEANLNASLFSWSATNDDVLESLCVDHLTGG